jgi:glycogen debranching enzyme
MIADWGREICGRLETAESREWLCTNGIGGFASGTLAEIFDGDAPFTPRGCIAQAWTVSETLQAWMEIQNS